MALPPVVVDFRIAGIAQVDRAFRSVSDASVRAEVARTKAVDKGTRDRDKLEQKAARDKEKSIADMAKRVDKSLAAETKSVEKAEREKQRQIDASAKYMARVRDNSATMAGRIAKQQADAEIRELKRVNDARRRFYTTVAGAGGRSISGMASGALALGGTALALGGGFAISSAVSQRLGAERQAAQLVNAVTTNGTAPKGADVNSIINRAVSTSIATGMSKEDLVGGALAYSRKAKGGDFGGAMANMSFFAKMAKVTGADINEIAGAAGTLQSQNQNLKAPEMQQMLLDVYAQGKAGSMSMTDAAKQIGVMASTRNSYQGDAATNQRKLLALGQIAAPQGSIEEAGTFVKDMTLEAGKHSKELKAMGVKFNSHGQMESPDQMVQAVFKGTGGDQTKIEKLFGARGSQVFGALGQSYNAAGGGDKGLKAVDAKMKEVTEASMSSADLEKQFQQVMSTNAEKMSAAMERIENALEAKLVPYLERFAAALPELLPKIERVIDAFDTIAKFLLDNPLAGIGAIIAAKVTKDVGDAMIGEVIKKILANAAGGKTGDALVNAVLGGGGGAGAAGGAGAGVVGAAGSVGAVGAVGVAALGGALYGTYMQNDAGQNAADAKAMFATNPAAYAREVAARKQQNQGLDPNSREYAANLAFINGGGGTGGAFNMTPEQKAIMEKGAKNPEVLQMGNAAGSKKMPITDLIDFKPMQKAIDDSVAALRNPPPPPKGDPHHPSRHAPMSSKDRGGSQ